jgi:hypothetical protein
MKTLFLWFLSFVLQFGGLASALTVNANFTSADTIPVTADSYTATGNAVNLTLGFAPAAGTNLSILKNTGIGFIQGTFSNLAQGQQVDLSFSGKSYQFVANYYGGSGNDLVLVWKNSYSFATGSNSNYKVPARAGHSGCLGGKMVVAVSGGDMHGLALCSDGTVAAWGSNSRGQLGNNSKTDSSVPVLVSRTGVLSGKDR